MSLVCILSKQENLFAEYIFLLVLWGIQQVLLYYTYAENFILEIVHMSNLEKGYTPFLHLRGYLI